MVTLQTSLLLNKEKIQTKLGVAVKRLFLVKVNVLVSAETVEVEDNVRLGVFAEDTNTVFDILLPKGVIKEIVQLFEEAGSKRVKADGQVAKTLVATTVFPDLIVKAYLLLGHLAGNPVPDITTLPPFNDRVEGVIVEIQVLTFKFKPLV